MEYLAYYLGDFATVDRRGQPLRVPEYLWQRTGVKGYSCVYGPGKVLTLARATLEAHTELRALPTVNLLTEEAANALKHAFRGLPLHNPVPSMGVPVPPGSDWTLLLPED